MQTFENQIVSRYECPVQLGPEERHNAFQMTQNVMLEDLEFRNCEFIGEGLVTYGAPVHRSSARNVRLKNCRLNSFFGIGAIFDDVVIDGLRTSRMPVILHGCAFRHVTLTGHLGRFLINRHITHDDERRNAAFQAANDAFYDTVDWALDISNARAACIEIRGAIPAELIRRNPDEQFAMPREAANGKRSSRSVHLRSPFQLSFVPAQTKTCSLRLVDHAISTMKWHSFIDCVMRELSRNGGPWCTALRDVRWCVATHPTNYWINAAR